MKSELSVSRQGVQQPSLVGWAASDLAAVQCSESGGDLDLPWASPEPKLSLFSMGAASCLWGAGSLQLIQRVHTLLPSGIVHYLPALYKQGN